MFSEAKNIKKKTPSKVAHNWSRPGLFFCTDLAAQAPQKQTSYTTKSPLLQNWVFRLGVYGKIKTVIVVFYSDHMDVRQPTRSQSCTLNNSYNTYPHSNKTKHMEKKVIFFGRKLRVEMHNSRNQQP